VSKHNNVNPDHYKVAGRERPGTQVAGSPKDPNSEREAQERWDQRQEKQQQEQAKGTPDAEPNRERRRNPGDKG
jgi:hypothetical protein